MKMLLIKKLNQTQKSKVLRKLLDAVLVDAVVCQAVADKNFSKILAKLLLSKVAGGKLYVELPLEPNQSKAAPL